MSRWTGRTQINFFTSAWTRQTTKWHRKKWIDAYMSQRQRRKLDICHVFTRHLYISGTSVSAADLSPVPGERKRGTVGNELIRSVVNLFSYGCIVNKVRRERLRCACVWRRWITFRSDQKIKITGMGWSIVYWLFCFCSDLGYALCLLLTQSIFTTFYISITICHYY